MKKILFVLPSLCVGGMERVQVTIANRLVALGYDITLLILQEDKTLASELDERVKLIYKPYNPHKIMRKIPYISHKFYDDFMWEMRASGKALYKYYIGKEKYDVEIAFYRGLPIKIIGGSTNPKAVKLAWVHNDFRFCGGINKGFKSFKQIQDSYSKFDKIVCVSKQAIEGFQEVIGQKEKLTNIYNINPIKLIEEKSTESCDLIKKEKLIVSCGRIVEQKGFDRLLRVAKKLYLNGFKFEMWIIGGRGDQAALQKYLEENSLTNVKLLGQQPNPYKYMKQADLYVCSSRYEGYNLTVAEALLLEIPVLSTNCTGPCEILDGGRYGIIVENSEDGLYQGIKYLLENPDKLAYYKERAKERKNFFDEEKIVSQIEGLFER